MKSIFVLPLMSFFTVALVGCTAVPLEMGADRVEFAHEMPKHCQFLGELPGSQGNWFTAAITSDAALMMGARNELKNKASDMGANVVVIDDKHHSARLAGGTYSSVVIGQAYLCVGRAPVFVTR